MIVECDSADPTRPQQEQRGDGPQVELEDAAQSIQTIQREVDSCSELVGEVLGEITQQGKLARAMASDPRSRAHCLSAI